MGKREPATVIDIRSARKSGNLACHCGSEWLDLPVNIDYETRRIVGWANKARCRECGAEIYIDRKDKR